jgi:hypothetical protein
MKPIFLDIDGVLNRWPVPFSAEDLSHDFIPECVRNFNRIIAATEAKIVISSSWRYLHHAGHFSRLGFSKLLRSHGVRGELIGFTRGDEGDEPRWAQIADWLRSPTEQVERYCIIDDDPDAFGGRPGVRTRSDIGLTSQEADLAIKLLNCPS